MERLNEVFHYLESHGKSRPCQIVKEVSINRRNVFKDLKVLRKRGLAKREGLHPRIFYSLVPGASLGDEAVNETAKSSKPKPSAPSSKELNSCQIDLKSALARLKYLESEFDALHDRYSQCLKEKNAYHLLLLKHGIHTPVIK